MLTIIKDNCISPCIVLCNYLDGAMYDLECGCTENYNFIFECIIGLKELGDPTYIKYLDRFETYIKENNIDF